MGKEGRWLREIGEEEGMSEVRSVRRLGVKRRLRKKKEGRCENVRDLGGGREEVDGELG